MSYDEEAKRLLIGTAPSPWTLEKGDLFDLELYRKHMPFHSTRPTGSFQAFTIVVGPLPFQFGSDQAEWESKETQAEKDRFEARLREADGLAHVLVTFISPIHLSVRFMGRIFLVVAEIKNGVIVNIAKERTL